jgi:hypothetical protein
MSRTRVRRIQKVSPILEVGVVNGLGDKSAEVDERFKEGLPIISCECGAQILLVPDLQAMNRAIKTHAAEHREKGVNTKNNLSTSGKISQLLSQLTLIRLSEQNKCVVS